MAVGAALHVPPEGLGAALHNGPGRLVLVQRQGVAPGIPGKGVAKDALQGCLHAVSIAVYAYSITLSCLLPWGLFQDLDVLHLFPREAGLFNIEWTPKWGVVTRHFGVYPALAVSAEGPYSSR